MVPVSDKQFFLFHLFIWIQDHLWDCFNILMLIFSFQILAVNVKSAFLMTKLVAPHMEKRG